MLMPQWANKSAAEVWGSHQAIRLMKTKTLVSSWQDSGFMEHQRTRVFFQPFLMCQRSFYTRNSFKVLLIESRHPALVYAGQRHSDPASRNGAQEDIQPHHQQDSTYNAHPNTTLFLLFEINVNTPVALSRSPQSWSQSSPYLLIYNHHWGSKCHW